MKISHRLIFMLCLGFLPLAWVSCCHHQKTTTTHTAAANDTVAAADTSSPKMNAVVSMQYAATGCGPVLLIAREGEEPLVLIPKTFPSRFSREGLAVSFRFRLLRMPHREGCPAGNMAEVWDVSTR